MFATAQTRPHVPADQSVAISHLHTALLTLAAVIVGCFLISVVLVASMMLTAPLPAPDGAAPIPQLMPQPTAEAGQDR